MTKLYTGCGDKGYTQTLNDNHISKCDALIELIGTLDEFSSCLGVAKIHIMDEKLLDDIERLQKKLVLIMGELAGGKICVSEECVKVVEKMTDSYKGEFDGFSIPGKNPASSYLDLARCVARRAERVAAKVLEQRRIREVTFIYLNRASDLVYAMSRYAEK